MPVSGPLDHAGMLVLDAMQIAYLHSDPWQGERLRVLAQTIEHEAEYAANRDRGLSIVRPRTGPPGRTVGWYWRHCPHVRALRRARGLWVPEA
jgi:hypothetical protein